MVDPFLGNVTAGELFDGYPPVEDCDLVSYLVLRTSFITMSQYNILRPERDWMLITNSWIKEVKIRKMSDKFLTCGRVSSWHINLFYVIVIYNTYSPMVVPSSN